MHKQFYIIFILILIFISCKNVTEKNVDKSISVKDGVSFRQQIFEKKYGTCKDELDCAEVKIRYPLIIGDKSAIQTINDEIINLCLLKDDSGEAEYDSFDEIADSLFNEYKQIQNDFKDYTTAWFITKNLTISGTFSNYLSLKNEVTMYLGGANTYYNINLRVYNLNTGERVSLTQFAEENKISDIVLKGERIFKVQKGIEDSQTTKDAGFWFENDQFYLPDNFNVSDSGIVVFYNLYEIAPRSEGTTEIFIPFN